MIFKTFDSDIDKISAKWGIFGKSFNDIGNAIVGRIKDINNGFQATDDLLGSFKDTDSVWKRLYPSKETIQSQMIDIDSLYPEKTDAQFTKLLGTLTQQQSLIDKTKGSWTDYFNNLGEGEKWQVEFVQNTNLQKASLDDVKKAYYSARDGAIAHNKELENMTLSAKAGQVALKALSIAGNMIAMWAITKGIELAIKGIDELAHSTDHCKERVEELMTSFKSSLDTANSNASRVEELADEYEELSKGVNNLGENVSLTSEEYEKYNSLVNEIADMFPNLVQGYTNEGNAILNLKGNVEQLRDAYKEAQQEAYNLLIASGEDSDGNDIIKQWEDTHDTGFFSSLFDFGADDVGGGISVTDAAEQLKAILNMTADQYREIERITSSGSRKEIAGLTDIEREIGYGSYIYKALGLDSNSTDEEFKNAQKQAKTLVQTYNAEIESALSDVETLANAYLMTNEDYAKLDEQSKNAASILVNNLNPDIANKFSTKEDVGAYVDSIVQIISSNPDAKDAMIGLFTMDTTDMPVDDIQYWTESYINTIAKILGEDPVELKVRLGFDDNTEQLKTKVQGFLKDEYDDKVGTLTKEDLDIASKLEIPEGTLLSWDELIAKIEEAKKASPDKTSYDGLSKSAKSTTESVNTLRSAISSVNDAFAEQNENGSISVDTMLAMVDAGYATALQFDAVTGACTINKEAMLDLVQAKIQNQIADLQLLQSNIQQKLADDGNVARESANGFYDLAKAKLASATAEQITSMKQFNDAQSQILALQNAMKNIQKIGAGTYTTKAPSSSASKAAKKTMEDIQKEWKEYLDKYLAMYKAELDAGLIDFNTYLNKSRSLLDEYYRDGKISAKDYWDSVKSLYENQLSIYDKVLSAVSRRIEKEVDGIQDIIDGLEEQNDALQKQLDEYDSILSVVDDVYEKQIQALEDEKELLQDKIDAINDANDALDLQRRKEEAIYALRRAQEQRTKKLFNGKEFVYTTDSNAIRDAQQTLQDIKTEELINNLEKEQEGIDAEIEKLQEYKEKWQEITSAKETEQNKQLAIALWGQDYERFILQNRLSDIESFKNNYVSIQKQIENNQGLIDSYNQKVDYYNKLKEQWSSISDAYKQSQEDQYAAMVLGAQWESNVLNSRLDTLNKFKNEYIAIQQAITNAAKEAAQAQAAQSVSTSSSSGSASTGSSNVSQISQPQQTKSFHVVQKVGSGYSTQSKAEQKIDRYNGDGVFWDGSNNKWYVFKNKNYSDTKFSTYDEAIKSDIYKKAGSLRGVAYYASGTNSAKKGLNIVGEAGTETYIDNDGNVSLVTEPTLIPMEGGETVKNAKETQDLLNPDNLVPVEMMEFPGINGKTLKLSTDEFMDKVASVMPNYSSMVQSAIQMPKYDFTPASRDNSTSVSIGEIHLHEVNNVDSLANAIIRELPSKISQKLGQ